MGGFRVTIAGAAGRRLAGRVATSLLGLVALALPALAEVDMGRLEGAKQAADELLRRAEGSAASGAMPRRSDPEVARLLDRAFDLSILGPGTVPMVRIGPVGELAMNGNRIGTAYILAGTGKAEVPADDRETLLRVDRNTATFAPEVGQFTDFQLAVTAAMARSALDFAEGAGPAVLAQPRIAAGLDQMRGGFGRVIGGVLKTFAIAGLDDEWRLRRVESLEGVAETAARFLGETEKTGVRQVSDEVAALLGPDLRARVQAFGRRVAAAPR